MPLLSRDFKRRGVMTDPASLRQSLQELRARMLEAQQSATMACQRATTACQRARMVRQHAWMVRLERSMPEANRLTRTITAAILARRGLLDGTPASKRACRTCRCWGTVRPPARVIPKANADEHPPEEADGPRGLAIAAAMAMRLTSSTLAVAASPPEVPGLVPFEMYLRPRV
jgi:hypothetical protein